MYKIHLDPDLDPYPCTASYLKATAKIPSDHSLLTGSSWPYS